MFIPNYTVSDEKNEKERQLLINISVSPGSLDLKFKVCWSLLQIVIYVLQRAFENLHPQKLISKNSKKQKYDGYSVCLMQCQPTANKTLGGTFSEGF